MDDLISTKVAAQILGVSRTTLWRWEDQGILVPVRIGGVIRYRREDIERLTIPEDAA